MFRGCTTLRILQYVEWQLYFSRANNSSIAASARLNKKRIAPTIENAETGHINLSNDKFAYPHLSNSELLRGSFVLGLSSKKWVVNNSLKLLTLGPRMVGRTMFEKLMRASVYGQFVGGETEPEIVDTVKRLQKVGIRALLAVPMEEDTDATVANTTLYNKNKITTLKTIDMAVKFEDEHPMVQVKITALLPASLCETISKLYPEPSDFPSIIKNIAMTLETEMQYSLKGLSVDENKQLNDGLDRIREMCKYAVSKNVILMVDAEYTYMNPAIDLLSLSMMVFCNKNTPLIYYTKQNNLKETFRTLKNDMDFIHGLGCGFCVKLVRGAYLDPERRLATAGNYSDPTNPSYEATTDMYHKSMELILGRMKEHHGKTSVIFASHNENTIQTAIKRIHELDLERSSGHIFFGQLYGMCDHVSTVLGQHGYLVFKSIPFGNIPETLAYLSRRAYENRSVLDRAMRERRLLWTEYRRRKRKTN